MKNRSIKLINSLMFLASVFLGTIINAQNVNIPDANFKQFLINNTTINTNGDQEISVAEAEAYTGEITILYSPVSDLTGINAFKNIAKLDCQQNQLTSLDVSGLTQLTHLICKNNQITDLNISNSTTLTKLDCSGNQLTNLDVSNNTALTQLICGGNQLTNLDISNHTALTKLICGENQITDLDLSNNLALTELNCSANQLTSLDVSNNTALIYLWCNANQLTDLNVTNLPSLLLLKCYANQLTHLDTSGLTALNTLYCANNQLTSLDFSNLPQLRFLTCHNNQFTDLDLSNLSELEYLMCQNNQLTSLNVANGINANNWKMWAHNNPDLTCIQHDENFDPNTNIQWKKDDTANWNTNCNIMATDDVNPSENKVKVYPNPFKKILHISSIEEVERIYIMDMSGKVVQSFTPQKELHLPHLNAGMYTVQLSYKDGSAQTMKVIKK